MECACFKNKPWLLSAFRPLDERKTDIGELLKLLGDAAEVKEVGP